MKKEYKKPTIYFESFELDTAIASCGAGANGGSSLGRPQQGNAMDCHFGSENSGMFLDTIGSVCSASQDDTIDEVPADADGDWYCYHQPEGTIKVFAS